LILLANLALAIIHSPGFDGLQEFASRIILVR